MKKDKLQIVLITYNRQNYLERTFKQIFAAKSPIKNLDVTILNNASTDGTDKLIAKYQKKFPNITHIKHPTNIGGNANICRAFEYGASCGKEYVWVLCDDDIYDFSGWKDVEKAIYNHVDLIGVANYVMKNKKQLSEKSYQFFQLSFVPAGIYKTSLITDSVLTNMYDTIYTMFQQSCLCAYSINHQKNIYFLRKAIVDNGLHIKDDKMPENDLSFSRGNNADEVFFRRKEQIWIIGFANIVKLLKDKHLQYRCMECAIPYKDIYGSWENFYNCMRQYEGTPYLLEIVDVLPDRRKMIFQSSSSPLLSTSSLIHFTKLEKFFSLKNTRDKKHKIITILGIKLKLRRDKNSMVHTMKRKIKQLIVNLVGGNHK